MEQLELSLRKRRGRQRAPLEQRFWAKVDKNGPVPPHVPGLGPCWVWTAAVNTAGYGVLSRGGEQRSALHLAHRLSWELHHGDAGDLLVCHRCDNPRCVRTEHMFLGTATDNAQDMAAKGRASPGPGLRNLGRWQPSKPPKRKRRLQPGQVRELRALLDAGQSRAAVAERFGITTTMVGYIVQGRYWAHVA